MVKIQREDFSADEAIKKLKNPETGCIVTFLGLVRKFSLSKKEVDGVEFNYDEKMFKKLEEVEKKAVDNFDIKSVVILHRIGYLKVSEKILLVAISSLHREAAFKCCGFIMNEIKNIHRPWMKETIKKP